MSSSSLLLRSFLLICLFLFSSSLASDLGWIVIPGLSEEQSKGLLETFDVRGIHPDMTLIVGSPSDLSTLQTRFPAATLIKLFDPERTYYIVERPEFAFSASETVASWAFNVVSTAKSFHMRIIYAAGSRYLISAPKIFGIQEFSAFPAETELVTLPKERILPISSHSALKEIEKKFTRRADIVDLVAQVDSTSLTQFDLFLTGERNDSSFTTRNSFSTQVNDAATWLATYYNSSGFSSEIKPFQSTYGPNVIATLKGSVEPNRYVVVGAHFDSRATDRSSPTQRAPGGNDDGSGTSILLEIARLIAKNNLKFKYSVILGSWCGEEQGLVGSRAYAAECRKNNVDIVAMLQGDMLAYRRPGEAAQCAFPNAYHDPALTAVVKNVVRTYVPDVQVCDTSACCSDQQSFYEQGYSATFFFERCGSIADDQYHREGDLVQRVGFDIEQWTYNAQAMFSSLLTLAEVL